MLHKDSVIVHSAALTSNSSKRILSEGSSVLVRVLKNNGNNSYTVSFAGNRLIIKSDLQLKEGSVFSAKIKLDGNQILLIRQIEKSVSGFINKLETSFDSEGKIQNPLLIEYFKKMGLAPDEINYTLYQTMKMLGLSFNKEIFQKIRTIVKKYDDRQKKAAQIAMILHEKGFQITDEEIRIILDELEFSKDGNLDVNDNFVTNDDVASALKKFVNDVFWSEKLMDRKKSLLALFNHTGFKLNECRQNGNWIFIPFEMKFLRKKELKKIQGNIKFLINQNNKTVEKISINCNFFEKNYKFVIYLNDNKAERISADKKLSSKEMEKLSSLFSDSKIGYSVFEEDLEFPVYPEEIKSVDGNY